MVSVFAVNHILKLAMHAASGLLFPESAQLH